MKVIDPATFVEMINAEMLKHRAYAEGMCAFLVPSVFAGRVTGFSYEGPDGVLDVGKDIEDNILSAHVVRPALDRL
jgi:hypothetical protein